MSSFTSLVFQQENCRKNDCVVKIMCKQKCCIKYFRSIYNGISYKVLHSYGCSLSLSISPSCTWIPFFFLPLARALVFTLKVSVNSQSSIHLWRHNMFLLTFLLFDVRHLHGKLSTHFPFCHHTSWIYMPSSLRPFDCHSHAQISNIIQQKQSQRNTPRQSYCFFFALHKRTPHKMYYMLHHHFHYYYYKHLFSVHIILAYIMCTWKLSPASSSTQIGTFAFDRCASFSFLTLHYRDTYTGPWSAHVTFLLYFF